MQNKYYYFFLFIGILIGCERPLKNPESLDSNYNNLASLLSKTEGDLNTLDGKISEKKSEMEKTEPQSGRFAYHRGRYWEMIATQQKLKQKKLSLEIALQLQKKESRIKYVEAFLKKDPWPPKEGQNSASVSSWSLSTSSSARGWSVKERIEKMKEKSTSSAPPQH